MEVSRYAAEVNFCFQGTVLYSEIILHWIMCADFSIALEFVLLLIEHCMKNQECEILVKQYICTFAFLTIKSGQIMKSFLSSHSSLSRHISSKELCPVGTD